MNGEATNSSAEKINKVCDYINQHLDEDLSIEQLSQIANFSKFHFHRQFMVLLMMIPKRQRRRNLDLIYAVRLQKMYRVTLKES